ncbi:MAG: hypothetical protein SGCHY_004525 [Lobulomycetales sp.]
MSQRSVGLAARAWALIDNWATVAAVEYESLDFDSMATPLAAPAGFVLHGVSVLFKLQEQEYITWNQDGAANDYPYMLWAAVMLLISTLNFLLVFGSSKEYVCAKADMYRYTLFHHPTESDSRNIYSSSVVPSPNARLVEIESSQGTLVRWQISTWNPPAFGMALFTVYSPMTAFCYILGRGNNGILLGAASWLMTRFLVNTYTIYAREREILHGELVKEFSDKFVYRQAAFRETDDAAVGTSDD